MRWKDILGRDVIDTTTAESVGSIDGLVADPESSSVAAIVVGGRTISWADAGGIGTDALTLSSGELLHEPSSHLEAKAVDGAGDPLGKRVITEDGMEIGSIDDIDLDPQSGAIGRLFLGDDDIKGSRLVGIGSFAVMVSSPGRTPTPGQAAAGGATSSPGRTPPSGQAAAGGATSSPGRTPPVIQAPPRPTSSGDVPSSGGAPSSGADDLDGLSKAELYEIAQDRDLAGRSSMTKQELIDALS